MTITFDAKQLVKRLLLGRDDYPQQFPIGLCEPQSEVSVSLHGIGAPRDVTHEHFMACGAPFTVALGVRQDTWQEPTKHAKPVLQFRSRPGDSVVLGEIGLRHSRTINAGTQKLMLFHVSSYRNYCIPRPRLWARYLLYNYQQSKMPATGVPITASEVRAMMVFYICPRPVVLVTASDGGAGNLFPMNLMGPVGGRHFAFALNATTPVSKLVEKAGAVALSSIPFELTGLAFQFGKNHRNESINWTELPFPTRSSQYLGFPVPAFSPRVREMSVETTHQLGSHTLFVARVTTDERQTTGPECFVIHGIYQAWRAQQLSQDRVARKPLTK